jgi:hypothetical protein
VAWGLYFQRMKLIRLFLILCSAVGVLAVCITLDIHRFQTPRRDDWGLLIIGFVLFANFIFLLSVSSMPEQPRLFRIFSLWLNAKEVELKKRSNPTEG